jgi:hypothetical protein
MKDKELLSKLFGLHDDDDSESSDDELNEERIMECKRMANNNNNQSNCLGVEGESNNGIEESSEESIDLSSMSEDPIGSNHPPSPFPPPAKLSLQGSDNLHNTHNCHGCSLQSQWSMLSLHKFSTC